MNVKLADWLLGLKQGDVHQTLSLLHSVISMLPTPPNEDGASAKRSRIEMEEPAHFVMSSVEESDIVEDIFLGDEVDDAPLTAVILVRLVPILPNSKLMQAVHRFQMTLDLSPT